MRHWLIGLLLLATPAQADELLLVVQSMPRLEWGYTVTTTCPSPTPSTFVQRSVSTTGTFSTIATLPVTATSYNLPPAADDQFYRVATACGVSNVVQYVATAPPGPTLDERVATLETKVATLQLNETADDAALAAVTSRVTAAEATNGYQDVAISVLESDYMLHSDAITALTARVSALETASPPPPSENLKATTLNADQIEITGLNCTSLKTTGTGLKRVVTCLH